MFAIPIANVIEPMLTIDPPPRAAMCGTVALLIRKSERRFVLIVRSHSSSVYSFHGCEG